MAPKSRWTNPYRIAALAVLLGAGVAMAYGHQFWGLTGVFLGGGLGKRAQGYSPPPPVTNRDSVSYVPPLKRPGRALWIASGVGLVLLVLSWVALQLDALHGGQQVWPVYAFAAVGLVAPFVWIRLYQRLKGQP